MFKSRKEFEEALTKSNKDMEQELKKNYEDRYEELIEVLMKAGDELEKMEDLIDKADNEQGNSNPNDLTGKPAAKRKMVEDEKKANTSADGKKTRQPKFFRMRHIKEVSKMEDHEEAKKAAHKLVRTAKGATKDNTISVRGMIERSKNVRHLHEGMLNNFLAHKSENLAVNRGSGLPIDNKVMHGADTKERDAIDAGVAARNAKPDRGELGNTRAGKAEASKRAALADQKATKDKADAESKVEREAAVSKRINELKEAGKTVKRVKNPFKPSENDN